MQNIAVSCFFTKAVLVTFGAIAFVIFVDTISETVIISSHSITEVSECLLFSQIHIPRFKL